MPNVEHGKGLVTTPCLPTVRGGGCYENKLAGIMPYSNTSEEILPRWKLMLHSASDVCTLHQRRKVGGGSRCNRDS